ncbi:MAG: hypothetical protein RR413_04040, partial [Christensenellaceae bacterium]
AAVFFVKEQRDFSKGRKPLKLVERLPRGLVDEVRFSRGIQGGDRAAARRADGIDDRANRG